MEYDEEPKPRRFPWWTLLIAVLTCAIGFAGGYYVGENTSKPLMALVVQPDEPEEESPDEADSTKKATTTESVTTKSATAKSESTKSATTKIEPTKSATPAKKSEASEKDYSDDPEVRYGAYRIVGVDTVVKVKAGDNLKKLSRFWLGPDMECYIRAINSLKAESQLTAGQSIKIPKLELKKKKNKK